MAVESSEQSATRGAAAAQGLHRGLAARVDDQSNHSGAVMQLLLRTNQHEDRTGPYCRPKKAYVAEAKLQLQTAGMQGTLRTGVEQACRPAYLVLTHVGT